MSEEVEPVEVELTTLVDLPQELLCHIVDHCLDHEALIGLSISCKALHSQVDVAERLIALAALRGWSSTPIPINSRLACTRRQHDRPSFVRRTDVPPCWENYGRRVQGVPAPHEAWALDGAGRTRTVGRAPRNSWAQYRSVRDAVAAATDGDTILILAGTHDEGAEPIEIKHSIRLLGDDDAPTTCRPATTVLQAVLVASAGQSSMCGITLTLPREVATPPHVPAHPGGPLGLVNLFLQHADGAGAGGGGAGGAEPEEVAMPEDGPVRCLWVTQGAIFTCDDCHLNGGVRAGSMSELALLGCQVTGLRGSPASTGVLAQGAARVVVRACVIEGHERSGITAQHSAALWLDHSCVAGCALTGVKLSSRMMCVISRCSIARNGHFGLLLRDRARCLLTTSELVDNASAGLACIHKACVRVDGSEIVGNDGFGLVCQHSGVMHLHRSLIQQNGGVGVLSAQEAHVVLTATTCTQNGGDAYQEDARARVVTSDASNSFVANGTGHVPPGDDEALAGPHVRSGRAAREDTDGQEAACSTAGASGSKQAPMHPTGPTATADVGPLGEIAKQAAREERLDEWPPETRPPLLEQLLVAEPWDWEAIRLDYPSG